MTTDDVWVQLATYIKELMRKNPFLTEAQMARAAALRMRADRDRNVA
jgi:hypothetical protein